jgi:hypothetical protein
MKKTQYVERTYNLGDYKSIKFSSALSDIPQSLALNDKITGLLYLHQFLTIETAYRRYYELIQGMSTASVKDALEKLETERVQTMKELYEEIQKTEETIYAKANEALSNQDEPTEQGDE